MANANPFLSTQKASDAVAALHPLVLLSISDHITRHGLRRLPGPIAGAILGQQNSRQVTLEHTFDFLIQPGPNDAAQVNPIWFRDRLEQLRLVHKDRQLDLVGWYTVLHHSGPTVPVVQIHEQLMPLCGESTAAVLLAFHPEDTRTPSVGGRLPLTIYETSYEPDEGGAVAALRLATAAVPPAPIDSGVDKEMTDVGDEPAAAPAPTTAPPLVVKFREMPYTIETGDAEMISIDFVAGGVANASAESAAASSSNRDRAVAIEAGNRGKRRLVAAADSDEGSAATAAATAATTSVLSRQDEELIATLTTRANAIRMLHSRLQLLTRYLASLEASEAREASQTNQTESTDKAPASALTASLPILRSIQALVQRQPLVAPPPVGGAFEEERQREANDVALTTLLLDDLMENISGVRQTSTKFSIIDQARTSRAGSGRGFRGLGGGGSDGPPILDIIL